MLAASTNWIGLADVAVGAVLSLVMALVGVIFKQMRDELTAMKAETKESGRHLEGIMFATWRILWRVDSAEDFLEKNHGYKPPRTVPEWPFNE